MLELNRCLWRFPISHQIQNDIPCLASVDHLAHRVDRNLAHRARLTEEFDRRGVLYNLPASVRIAEWAYANAEHACGLTWTRSDVLVPLVAQWRQLLQPIQPTMHLDQSRRVCFARFRLGCCTAIRYP